MKQRLIQRIELKNFLSFGPESPTVELGPLNVLIGPNGSGKSNLITALAFLHKLPEGTEKALATLGDPTSVVWSGHESSEFAITVHMTPFVEGEKYQIAFRVTPQGRCFLLREMVLGESRVHPKTGAFLDPPATVTYYNSNGAVATIREAALSDSDAANRRIEDEKFRADDTVLAQRAYEVQYPVVYHLQDSFKFIGIYRSWEFGWDSKVRKAQTASQPANRVEEDWSNYQLVLNRICGDPKVKAKVLKYLNALAPGLQDIGLDTLGGAGALRITEGDHNVTMDRLSDGTLRVLALLAVFCHPKPAPFIVFEEPELGLHPDMLPTIADLLRDASERAQILVTTHSDILVDAFTESPQDVLVCEKRKGQTWIRPARPSKVPVSKGGQPPSLGTQWLNGTIGGKRW